MADVTVFVSNSCFIWILLGLTEAIVIRALQLMKFQYVSGINDNFFARLIFRLNVCFTLGTHISSFYLGSLGSNELLTGVLGTKRPTSLFHDTILGGLSVISTVSLVTCAIKKFEAYWKERKLVNNINIMINNVQGQPQQKLNNKKHNDPIVNIYVAMIYTILVFGIIFIVHFMDFGVNHSASDVLNVFWFGWAVNIYFRTVQPVLIITFYHKTFRNFILRTLHDFWTNICL
jgi:hypothetical protein